MSSVTASMRFLLPESTERRVGSTNRMFGCDRSKKPSIDAGARRSEPGAHRREIKWICRLRRRVRPRHQRPQRSAGRSAHRLRERSARRPQQSGQAGTALPPLRCAMPAPGRQAPPRPIARSLRGAGVPECSRLARVSPLTNSVSDCTWSVARPAAISYSRNRENAAARGSAEARHAAGCSPRAHEERPDKRSHEDW